MENSLPGILLLQEWVDGLVLGVEVAHVHNQVLDNKHMWQGCHLCLCVRRALDLRAKAQCGARI